MRNVRTEDLIVIDIETASVSSSYDLLEPHWQKLWHDKTNRILPENTNTAEFYPMRAGVMAEFSKIICISIGYFIKEQNLKIRVKSFYGDDEKSILTQFLQTITKIESFNNRWCFAGHNIKEFDIPFICRRLLVNEIKIPAYLDFQNMKPWETNIIDTFQYWRFGDYKNFTSLNLLAAAMNVPSSKDDIDGSMVGELYHTGDDAQRKINMNRIKTYCQKDVVTTANIILRFKNIPLIHKDDVEVVE
jgi:3'-5' exonuclease